MQLTTSPLDIVRQHFSKDRPYFLNREEAIAYILSVLITKDSYGTELARDLQQQFPNINLSDSILHNAIEYLKNHNIVEISSRRLEGRGRPRSMLSLVSTWRSEAENIAQLWHQKIQS